MKIFEKALQAVRDFDSTMRAAIETYKTARQKAMDNYAGALLAEKLADIESVMSHTEMKEKAKLREVLKECFTEAKTKVYEVASADAPAGFMETLAAIRAVGETISDYEAVAYLEKYRHNYVAARAIGEELQKVRKGNYTIVRPDAVINEIESVEKRLQNWLQNYNPNEYMTRVLLHPINPVSNLEEYLENWLDGGFVHNAEAAGYITKEAIL